MNEATIRRVQNTWVQVVPLAEVAAELFYRRLFQLDPSLEAMFPLDLTAQKKKLMKTLGVAVCGLQRLESILPTLQELGRGHAGYGVEEADYDTVGQALLWALRQGLGEDFTPEVEAAWTEVYVTVATVMKEAAAKMRANAA